MGTNLRILLLLFSIFWFLFISYFIRKNCIPVKYSLIWFFAAFVILLIVVFPNLLINISNFFGFMTISNMVVGIILFLLLLITFILTGIVSNQRKQITLLIQELSIVKKEVEKDEK